MLIIHLYRRESQHKTPQSKCNREFLYQKDVNVIKERPGRRLSAMERQLIITSRCDDEREVLPIRVSGIDCVNHSIIPDNIHKGRRLK
jgi:hypothetical protein